MSSLNLRSFNSYVQGQAAAMQGRAKALLNRTLDFSVGSTLRCLTEANASVALWLQAEIVKVLLRTRARTSEGTELDTFVEDFGLTRLQSVSASGTLTFSRLTPATQAVIPIGAEAETTDGTARFVVVADPSNPAYTSSLNGYVVPAGVAAYSVPVLATVAGPAGNAAAGTVTVLRTVILHIDTVSNAGSMSGGGETESDADLRTRFIDFIQSLSRGTIGAILFAVRSVRAGVTATLIENTAPDGSESDLFTVTVDDGTGSPSLDLLSKARAAVERYRPAGVRYAVVAPEAYPVSVYMSLAVTDGFDSNTLIGQVAAALQAHVQSRPLGYGISASRLSAIAHGVSQGIENVTGVKLNNSIADLPAHKRRKYVVQSISVT